MTLLAGFDFALELAQPLIRAQILKDLRLGGVSLYPPAEFVRTFTISGIQGIFHCVIDDVEVDIGSPTGEVIILITLRFSQGSIRAISMSICPLAGTVTLRVPLAIKVKAGATREVVADLPKTDVNVFFDLLSAQRIDQRLAGSGMNSNDVVTLMNSELKNLVGASGPQPINGLRFGVTPGINGNLGNPPTFTEATLLCLYNPIREQQALVLLGTLLAANSGQGDPSKKTRSIPLNRNICLSISPSAIRTLVFCPAVAGALSLPAGTNAPGVCGGPPATVSGVTITNITDQFTTGAINVNVTFTNSGLCYTADGSVTITLTPNVSGGSLTFSPTAGKPTVTISIPWYCYLAAFVLSPILGTILSLFDLIADSLFSQDIGSLASMLTSLSPAGGAVPFSVEEAAITNDGLTIASTLFIKLPMPVQPRVRLNSMQRLLRSEVVGEGTRQLNVPGCDVFTGVTWSEQRRWFEEKLDVQTILYGYPINVAWELKGDAGPSIPLVGIAGTAQVPVNASYETSSSTTSVTRTASIGWYIGSGSTSLVLNNDPADGNYAIQVIANLTNCAGTLQTALVSYAVFNGHLLQTQTYGVVESLQRCFFDRYVLIDLPPISTGIPWPPILEGPIVGPLFLTLSSLNDPDAQSLAQGLPLILASEMREAAFRRPRSREFNEI